MATVNVPEAPTFLPKARQAEWKKKYEEGHKQAQQDEPDDPPAHHRGGLREANRMLRTSEITSAEQAQSMPEHLFLKRDVEKGVLKVVTIDGKKYSFPVGKSAASPSAEPKDLKSKIAALKTKADVVAFAKAEFQLQLDEASKREDLEAAIFAAAGE